MGRPVLLPAAAAALAAALGAGPVALALGLGTVVWCVGLAALVVRDGAAAPRVPAGGAPGPRALVVHREVPRRVGLDLVFRERVTLDLAAAPDDRDPVEALGRLSVEVHGDMPPSLVAVELAVGDDGEVTERDLPELERARGHRLTAADARLVDATGAPVDRAAREGDLWRLTLDRSWRARRRGLVQLGSLAVLPSGPAGLARRREVLAADEPLRVESALLGRSRTLELVASERGQDLGLKRLRRRRGGQTEFESLRDYVTGDEPRSIDWKAFARRGKPTVRQYEPERGQELVLLVDCGRRMAAPVDVPGIPRWSKLDHALDAGLQLAAAVLSQGDRVGLLAFDGRPRAWVAPARSGAQFERLKQASFALQPSTDEADLGAALAELSARHRRAALVLVLSDLADPAHVDEQARALARAGRHRIQFGAFGDPDLERAAEDPTPERTALRAAALAAGAERTAGLAAIRARRVQALDLPASAAAAPLLAAWFAERRAGV